jgi:hypothetical protein
LVATLVYALVYWALANNVLEQLQLPFMRDLKL